MKEIFLAILLIILIYFLLVGVEYFLENSQASKTCLALGYKNHTVVGDNLYCYNKVEVFKVGPTEND